ncbi:MAG: galactokinase [Spirochaetaceae bacterium]|nr:galactokinase [Spirochaetaceae bacterium]
MRDFSGLKKEFYDRYGSSPQQIFSCPGRTEICGNHTDHNSGKVLAASIGLDCVAAVSKTDTGKIRIFDSVYNEDFSVDLTDLAVGSKGSVALLKGILSSFSQNGFKIGSFDAAFSGNIISASGLSSSAAFGMLLCGILNEYFNEGKIPVEKLAFLEQAAEHSHWQKKIGLMDQISCAAGGMVYIDFEEPQNPKIQRLDVDFDKFGYEMLIVNTGGNHADLSPQYSAIPGEMKSVAAFFGKEVLRQVAYEDFLKNGVEIRKKCGDRAFLRAIHYFRENLRVEQQVQALNNGDFPRFLQLVSDSGKSSAQFLQNGSVAEKPEEQPMFVFLALTEAFFAANDVKGVTRIHGGGFAGVIQVFLPKTETGKYRSFIEECGYSPDIVLSPGICLNGLRLVE